MSIVRTGTGTTGTVSPIPADSAHDNWGGDPSQLLSPVAVVGLGAGRLVTAQRTGLGALQITAWTRTEAGLVETGQIAGDAISAIVLCAPSERRVVSAARNGSGDLELIAWDIGEDGRLSRRGTGRAGEVTAVAACALSGTRVVAAMRNGSGNLELISWRLDASGNLQRLGTAEAGGIWAVGLTRISDSRLVAVMQNASQNLELIVWDVADDGTFTRKGEGDAGTVAAVAISAWTGARTDTVVTAMRNGSLDLELISWDLREDGTLTRTATGNAGIGTPATGERSNIGLAITGDWLVSAARNSDGYLDLASWVIYDDGVIRVNARTSAETISAVSISDLGNNALGDFATAVGNAEGQLEVITWTAESYDVGLKGRRPLRDHLTATARLART